MVLHVSYCRLHLMALPVESSAGPSSPTWTLPTAGLSALWHKPEMPSRDSFSDKQGTYILLYYFWLRKIRLRGWGQIACSTMCGWTVALVSVFFNMEPPVGYKHHPTDFPPHPIWHMGSFAWAHQSLLMTPEVGVP